MPKRMHLYLCKLSSINNDHTEITGNANKIKDSLLNAARKNNGIKNMYFSFVRNTINKRENKNSAVSGYP